MPASSPYILVDIADDKPQRGDVRAVRGLAKAVARKTGWAVHEIDGETAYRKPLGFALLDILPMDTRMRPPLDGLHEGSQGLLWNHYRDHIHRVQAHIALHGPPSIVLATPSARVFQGLKFASTDPDATFKSLYQCDVIARHWAETLAMDAHTGMGVAANDAAKGAAGNPNRNYSLVAHDLSAEDFANAADEFRARFPQLTNHGPLVTVFYSDQAYPKESEKKIARLLANEGRATLVLCGAPRTEQQERVEAYFAENLPETVRLHSFRFDPGAAYNPYVGLVGASDHLVRQGISQSIDSEIFATGKPVHVMPLRYWEKPLAEQGYFRDLSRYGDGDRLASPARSPINITDQLADKLIAEHQQAQAARLTATPRRLAM